MSTRRGTWHGAPRVAHKKHRGLARKEKVPARKIKGSWHLHDSWPSRRVWRFATTGGRDPDVDLRRSAASHHQAELGGRCPRPGLKRTPGFRQKKSSRKKSYHSKTRPPRSGCPRPGSQSPKCHFKSGPNKRDEDARRFCHTRARGSEIKYLDQGCAPPIGSDGDRAIRPFDASSESRFY